MATLVTGAAGFVGLNVLEHLLARRHPVVALDRRSLPEPARIRFAELGGNLTIVPGEVENAADLATALTASSIQTVIHCAVITAGAQREATDPQAIVAANVQAAVNTLVTAAHHGVRRFVYPSSGAVYGLAARGAGLLDEDSLAPQPANLYGATKWAAEILLGTLARSRSMEFVAARLGTVYGPWEHATGVRDTLSPMLQSVELMRQNQPAILSPAHTADYIYSRDVAAGLAALAQAPALPRALYNLGTGQTTSASAWCQELAALNPQFQWRLARDHEAPNVLTHTSFDRPAMNINHIANDIGFKPRFTLADAAKDYLNTQESRFF